MRYEDVSSAADNKREKAGGFERGIVLYETSIGGKRSEERQYSVLPVSQSGARLEIPFTFFGFGQLQGGARVELSRFGLDALVKIETDRLSIELSEKGGQLDFDFEGPEVGEDKT